MVKLAGPCMSLGASGKLGGALVFSRWKGRPYARTLVTPANPKSTGQVSVRAMMKWLSQQWKDIGAAPQGSWDDRAKIGNISPFNAFCGYNLFRWRNFLAPTDTFPEAETDVAPTEGVLAAVAAERAITVTQPITTAADGWGIMFFRSPTATFESGYNNLKHVGLVDATNDVLFIDSPLAPGTYYYEIRSITKDGQLGSASSEVDATVT